MDIRFDQAGPLLFEVAHRSTMYRIHKVNSADGSSFFMVVSGRGGNHGEWIRLIGPSIAWSYLAEKMPQMARLDGDKEGWVKVFAMAGVEVFN